jgi:NADPH2:quinone reductase
MLVMVQLARAAGGRVIGAARGRRKLAVVSDAGADAVVDYSQPGWAGQVRELTAGHGPDVVFDGAGGTLGRSAFEIIAAGAGSPRTACPAPGSRHWTRPRRVAEASPVNGIGAYEPEVFRQRAAAALAGAADAHAALESRLTVAKTLLRP